MSASVYLLEAQCNVIHGAFSGHLHTSGLAFIELKRVLGYL